jgi:hypothetical protein
MKRFGIRITLPENDPMALPHLLGAQWESFRWYDREADRDRAMGEMGERHLYSRTGDAPKLVLSKIERRP